MTRKRTQLFVSLVISTFFLYLAFKNVDFGTLWTTLRTVNYWWAIPFMAVTVLSMWFRTIRWRYLLLPVVDVPTPKLFSPLIICFFLNSILPGRVGEFARAYLVGRDHKVPFSSAFATVVVERIADALGLLAFFVVMLAVVKLGAGIKMSWGSVKEIEGSKIIVIGAVSLAVVAGLLAALAAAMLRAGAKRAAGEANPDGPAGLLAKIKRPKPVANVLFVLAGLSAIGAILFVAGVIVQPDQTYTWGREYVINGAMLTSLSKKMLVIGIVLLAGSILMLWSPFQRFVQGCVSWTPLLPHGFKDGLNRFIETFTHGFHSLRSPKIVFWVIFHTATVWLAVGASIVLMAYGFPGIQLDFMQGMAVCIIICIAILIPAAPGYWGLYEVGCILALMFVLGKDFNETAAAGFALVLHFLQMVPILALGFWFLWKRSVKLAELTAAEEKEAE